jgi:hypothetical protein
LVNGKFRTPKITSLHLLIDWLNEHNAEPLAKLPLDRLPLSKNSWLAGFSSCDCTFAVRTSETGKYRNYNVSFSLSQSRIDPQRLENYEPIMSNIAEFLSSKLEVHNISTFDRQGKQPGWRARTVNRAGNALIVNYFSEFPLLNSKELDFIDWRECYDLTLEKKH